jgi:hypothetical protein
MRRRPMFRRAGLTAAAVLLVTLAVAVPAQAVQEPQVTIDRATLAPNSFGEADRAVALTGTYSCPPVEPANRILAVTVFVSISQPVHPGTGFFGANDDFGIDCESSPTGTWTLTAMQGAPEAGLELPFHPGSATAGIEVVVTAENEFQVFNDPPQKVILRPH